MFSTEQLRKRHKRNFKRIDKFVAVVVAPENKNRILFTYQSAQGNGVWKLTMVTP